MPHIIFGLGLIIYVYTQSPFEWEFSRRYIYATQVTCQRLQMECYTIVRWIKDKPNCHYCSSEPAKSFPTLFVY
ncbi:hypothetical protein HanIR_Chr02g0072821 [Helianthus annuus]|nr:hypothetical protein HanIR_Chr02g0072821 [Helianthus annuus]